MNNRINIAAITLALASLSTLGADSMSNGSGMHYEQGEYYRANELSVDAFGSAALGKYTFDHLSGARIRRDTQLGVGVGVSYFITRNLGFGVDAYSDSTRGVFVDSASANVTFRFPLDQSGFAPYVFGGGGHQFDNGKAWFCQAGGGIEYRFTPQIGTFLDARWVLPDEGKYYGVARLGVRFAF